MPFFLKAAIPLAIESMTFCGSPMGMAHSESVRKNRIAPKRVIPSEDGSEVLRCSGMAAKLSLIKPVRSESRTDNREKSSPVVKMAAEATTEQKTIQMLNARMFRAFLTSGVRLLIRRGRLPCLRASSVRTPVSVIIMTARPVMATVPAKAILHRSPRGVSSGRTASATTVSAWLRLITVFFAALAAIAWTLEHIAEYGGSPRKVFVAGHSAGGYLTCMAGMDARRLAKYGHSPTELAGLIPVSGQVTKHFAVRSFSGDKDPQYQPKIDGLAPLFYCTAKTAPVLFITGDRRVEFPCRVEENEFMAASMRKLGREDVSFLEIPERTHATVVAPSGPVIRDFIRRRAGL